MTEITQNALAELCGMSPRTIKKRLAASGVVALRKDGAGWLYDSVAALKAVYGVEQGEHIDLSAERARLVRAKAEHAEMELAKRRGELIELDDAIDEFEVVLSNARQRFIQLPYALR